MSTIEGLSPDELLALPDDELDVLVLSGDPLTFRSGTAEILGRFERCEGRLVMGSLSPQRIRARSQIQPVSAPSRE